MSSQPFDSYQGTEPSTSWLGKNNVREEVCPWDPLALAQQLQNIAKQSQILMQRFVSSQADSTKVGMGDASTLGFDFVDLMTKMIADPMSVAKAQIDLFNDSLAVWQKTAKRMLTVRARC